MNELEQLKQRIAQLEAELAEANAANERLVQGELEQAFKDTFPDLGSISTAEIARALANPVPEEPEYESVNVLVTAWHGLSALNGIGCEVQIVAGLEGDERRLAIHDQVWKRVVEHVDFGWEEVTEDE